MNTEQAFQIAQAILLSLGGGAIIVVGLSSWLGKVWASRMMVSERAKYASELEELKAKLHKEAEHNNHLLLQKISLYKEAANPVIALVVKALHQGDLPKGDLQQFDNERLSTTALLAMFAPQDVFDTYNDMIDYIYDSFEKKQDWEFDTFRDKALIFLSGIRRDIGLYDDSVHYNGTR